MLSVLKKLCLNLMSCHLAYAMFQAIFNISRIALYLGYSNYGGNTQKAWVIPKVLYIISMNL